MRVSPLAGRETPGRARLLIAASELEQRKRELSRRLDRIDAERRVFEEVRDSLMDEERTLLERLNIARKKFDRILERMDARTQRSTEIMAQIEGLERTISAFERMCSDNTRRQADLQDRIHSVEKDVASTRRRVSLMEAELEAGRESLGRMKRKISCKRMDDRACDRERMDDDGTKE